MATAKNTSLSNAAWEAPAHAVHSSAWVAGTQVFFVASLVAMIWGISQINLDVWAQGYLAMGTMMCVFASINLAKTLRDVHEASRLTKRVEGAKLDRFLADHDSLSTV